MGLWLGGGQQREACNAEPRFREVAAASNRRGAPGQLRMLGRMASTAAARLGLNGRSLPPVD